MKTGKPLVLVVNRCGTVKRSSARGRVRQQSHLRLVAAEGVSVAGVAAAGESARAPTPRPFVPEQQRPRSLSRRFGQRVVMAANDVAVLALALFAGLYPRA